MKTPLQILGALPIGDPAAMRAAAQRLRSDADALESCVHATSSAATGTAFEGPAADRWRGRTNAQAAALHGDAAELRAIADTLAVAAGRLADQQASYRSRFAQLQRAYDAEVARLRGKG